MSRNSDEINQNLQIHGSMFILFQRFVEFYFDNGVWMRIKKSVSKNSDGYDMHKNYRAEEMFLLIREVAALWGNSENDVKEKFGEYLVPDLMRLYQSHVNPDWKTFELLENTELVMHKAVRKQEKKANPPRLNVSRVHDKLLIIDYYSRRKMASLGIGIIKGIAKYYNESERVTIAPMTSPDDERVQIRVDFR